MAESLYQKIREGAELWIKKDGEAKRAEIKRDDDPNKQGRMIIEHAKYVVAVNNLLEIVAKECGEKFVLLAGELRVYELFSWIKK